MASGASLSIIETFNHINSSIESARKRSSDLRREIDRVQTASQQAQELRERCVEEAEEARKEAAGIDTELAAASLKRRARAEELEKAQRENELAKREHEALRRRIDEERVAFLDRCREFRAECKRMRVAASLLVIDGGCQFEAKDASDEVDLWRRLQEEDFSSDEEEGEVGGETAARPIFATVSKKRKKRPDPEMEKAIQDEKDSRDSYIQAECQVHSVREKHAKLTKESEERRVQLDRQRAQLARHRREVEDLDREVKNAKDDVVQANQAASAYEKEFNRRKNTYSSYSSSNANARSSGSADRNSTSDNPYQQQNVSGRQHHRVGNDRNKSVSNPYNNSRRSANTRYDYGSSVNNSRAGQQQSRYAPPTHSASEMITPDASQRHQWNASDRRQQNPWGGRAYSQRNQRQFGTAVGVDATFNEDEDEGVSQSMRNCMAAFSASSQGQVANGLGGAQERRESAPTSSSYDSASDDEASVSSGEEMLEFNIFSKNDHA